MANKLVTVTQLDTAVDGFASAVAAAGYEKKANLKKLAYEDDVTIDVMATDLKTLLEGKMTQTKAQQLVNQNVGKAYKPGGSKTLATLPALTETNFGHVYHMTDEFTTTADFIEGAGKTYTAGTEVAIVEVPGANEGDPVTYKYNVLSSYIDTTKFASQSSFSVVQAAVQNIQIASNSDIQALIDGMSLDEEVWDVDWTVDYNDNLNCSVDWHNDNNNLDKRPTQEEFHTLIRNSAGNGEDIFNGAYYDDARSSENSWYYVDQNPSEGQLYQFMLPEIDGYTKTFTTPVNLHYFDVTYTYTGGAQMITVDTNKITDDELNPDKISYIASNDQNTKTVYIPASKNWSSAINSVILWGMSKDGETEINVTPASYNILANTIFDGNWDTVAAVLNESDYNNVMENEENIKVTFDTAGSDNSDG